MLLNKSLCFRIATCLAVYGVLVVSSLAGPPDGKGGGKGGGGNGGGDTAVTLPPMAFELTFLPIQESTIVHAINNNLQVVGWTAESIDGVAKHNAFLYDYTSGVVARLEDLISADDLASIAAQGFTQSKFRGINDAGLIVGYVANTDYTFTDGIIIDSHTGQIVFTSTLGFDSSYLLHVNKFGELLGGYFVGTDNTYSFVAKHDASTGQMTLTRELDRFSQLAYNSAITDTGLVMLRDGTYDTWEYDFASDELTHISRESDGVFLTDIDSLGRYVGQIDEKQRRKTATFPVAFDPSSSSIIWKGTSEGSSTQINDPSLDDVANGVDLGDVLFVDGASSQRNPILLRNPVLGEINVDLLIDPNDPDINEWLQYSGYNYTHMTEKRSDTNFGAITGSATVGLVPFILVPKPFVRQ